MDGDGAVGEGRRIDIDLYKHLNKDQLIATSAVQERQNYCSNKHSMVFGIVGQS